jgi:flavin-dependent dehydrogenase
MIDTSVLIVGGGPAGSACAWQLRQHHIDCIILDQVQFPRFKPCAGWITPAVVKQLELKPANYPYGLSTFTSLRVNLNGLQIHLPTRQYAIRRYEFDEWLLRRSGSLFYQHSVKNIRYENGTYIIDDRFQAKYLIGAGGTYCPVYRNIFRDARPRTRDSLIAAQEEEFPYDPPSMDCRLWFWKGLPGYAWYVPKANGYVNVGIGAWAERLKTSGISLKTHWEHFLEQLDAQGLIRNHTFHPSAHSYYLRQPSSQIRLENAFLVGDAAGLATLDMGEGISPAIQSGLRAVQAIATGRPYSLDGIAR